MQVFCRSSAAMPNRSRSHSIQRRLIRFHQSRSRTWACGCSRRVGIKKRRRRFIGHLGLEPGKFCYSGLFSCRGVFRQPAGSKMPSARWIRRHSGGRPGWRRCTRAAGRRREATELIGQIVPAAKPADFVPVAARISRTSEDKDRAFEWLTKAFDARTTPVGWAKSRYADSTPSVTIHGSTPWSHGCTCQANDLGQELTPQSVGHPSVIDLPLARWVDFRSRTMSAMTG